MSKYDKLGDSFRKAQQFASVGFDLDRRTDKIMRENDYQRRFKNSYDEELMAFGRELFENGYDLEYFMQDLELCIKNMDKDKGRTTTYYTYEGVTHVPTYAKMMEIVKNPDLIIGIQNYYNIAKRRAMALEAQSQTHKGR